MYNVFFSQKVFPILAKLPKGEKWCWWKKIEQAFSISLSKKYPFIILLICYEHEITETYAR